MDFDQGDYQVKCEWGLAGLSRLLPVSDVIIIVDIFSFSTCVEIAVANGALVYPFGWQDQTAVAFARSLGAELAKSLLAGDSRYSLSPTSLLSIPAGTRLVLPSPNGATLSLATGRLPTLAGCLRNARAVAARAEALGRRVSVIPAGERWEDGSLRPAVEDWLGAGAIIDNLKGARSPEAQMAVGTYRASVKTLEDNLRNCSSGKELSRKGRANDILLAAALNTSLCVPLLIDGAYTRFSPA